MSETELMKYFKFDEADRAANQAGHFTQKQKRRFIAESRTNKKWSRIWGILLLVIAALGLVLLAYGWTRYPVNRSMAIVFLLAGGIWTIVGGSIGGIVLARLFANPEFKVASVQGHARIVEVQSSYANNRVGVHQELHIGGKRFAGGKSLGTSLPEDDYVVYYLDRPSKKPAGITYPCAAEDILSVEVLKKADPTPPAEP
jgi:hypothetical protein